MHLSQWLGVCLGSDRCSLDTNSFANIKYEHEQTIQIYTALSQLSSVHLPVWTCARLLTQKQMNQGNWICALSLYIELKYSTKRQHFTISTRYLHTFKGKKALGYSSRTLSLQSQKKNFSLLSSSFSRFSWEFRSVSQCLPWVVFFNIFRDVSLFWFVYKVCNFLLIFFLLLFCCTS